MYQLISLLLVSALFLIMGIVAKDKQLIFATVGIDMAYLFMVFILTM